MFLMGRIWVGVTKAFKLINKSILVGGLSSELYMSVGARIEHKKKESIPMEDWFLLVFFLLLHCLLLRLSSSLGTPFAASLPQNPCHLHTHGQYRFNVIKVKQHYNKNVSPGSTHPDTSADILNRLVHVFRRPRPAALAPE